MQISRSDMKSSVTKYRLRGGNSICESANWITKLYEASIFRVLSLKKPGENSRVSNPSQQFAPEHRDELQGFRLTRVEAGDAFSTGEKREERVAHGQSIARDGMPFKLLPVDGTGALETCDLCGFYNAPRSIWMLRTGPMERELRA